MTTTTLSVIKLIKIHTTGQFIISQCHMKYHHQLTYQVEFQELHVIQPTKIISHLMSQLVMEMSEQEYLKQRHSLHLQVPEEQSHLLKTLLLLYQVLFLPMETDPKGKRFVLICISLLYLLLVSHNTSPSFYLVQKIVFEISIKRDTIEQPLITEITYWSVWWSFVQITCFSKIS